MKVPEVDGYTELNYVQSFFHFNGAYFGKLLGEVCLDDIKAAIVTYNPYVNLDAIELVIVDYDEVVYFFAIDTNDIGLLRLIDQQKIIGKPIRFSEPNNARRPNGIIYKDEHKKCYPYLKTYSKVTVKQTQPNFNSHGISILMKGTSIAIETPSGHKIVWSTVS